ncbi:alpha/beta fold hydrolase [Nocardioides mangrovicus]|uniref:Alpha/beta fold hydrolase n=1 Tax=Nocardioides mangrovicus TaxID=2478913 RepID=A0A3L8P908_9ACTN|nr:alpha/beta hydrolase [Nocardioides mangrovicus]RLV51098.1 alpha/beta fold hydrolase [Nocardioides mangrovicus]
MSKEARLRFGEVRSADGTRLVTWTNDVASDLPTVLLCNGLGTNAHAWPALLDPDCGVRVVSWNHRGVSGSDRPSDRRHVGQQAFIDDALAVLDDAAVERCVVAGWSIGVGTACRFALAHPDRVRGLFALAGVPDDPFGAMGGPLHVPRPVARAFGRGLAGTLARIGAAFTPLTQHAPVTPRTTNALAHSGFMRPVADLDTARRAVAEFLTTPVDWYAHAARTLAADRVDVGRIAVPATFVGARHDLLARAADVRAAAARVLGATYVELDGSHFVQLEQPDAVHGLLVDLLTTVSA